MMRPVVFITHEFYPKRGGIAVFTEEMARAAIELDINCSLWAPQSGDLRATDWPFRIKALPIKGNLNWPDRLQTMRAMLQSKSVLEASEVVLIEPGPIYAAMYLNAIDQLPLDRFHIMLHGTEIPRFAACPMSKVLFTKLLSQAANIGVNSRYTGRLLKHCFPNAPQSIIVPGGLRHDCPDIEHSSGPAKKCTLLSVGRIHPRKGQHCLLEAAHLLPETVKNKLKIRIVGPPGKMAYQKKVEALANNCGVEVELIGQLPDDALSQAYSQADIFALTSERQGIHVEGFGLVCLEAGSAGLPVIAHNSGGIADAVKNGRTGLLVGPANRPALARAIAQLVESPLKREQLGAANRKWAASFRWRRNLKSLLQPR